jgi:uncharacterized protein
MGNNAVNWWEHPATDLPAAQKFYGDVLGWTFTPFGDDYTAVSATDGTMIGAITKSENSGARLYAGVDDLETTLAAAVSAGGKVIKERTLISEEMGWWGLIEDPNGREFGLWTTSPAKS